jgi:hypothetical protein
MPDWTNRVARSNNCRRDFASPNPAGKRSAQTTLSTTYVHTDTIELPPLVSPTMKSIRKHPVMVTGQLHGWETATQGTDSITLTSENHKDSVVVRKNPTAEGWLIHLQSEPLAEELAHIRGPSKLNPPTSTAASKQDLAEIFDQASRLARTLSDLPRRLYQQAVAEQLFCVSEFRAAAELRQMVRNRVAI